MDRIIVVAAMVATLLAPSTSFAFLEVGVGWGLTSFEDDLGAVETGSGLMGELTVGGGASRLMLAAQSSDHDPGGAAYSSWGVGPSWRLDLGGAVARVCALLSSHSLEDVEGWGVTLGGGVGWPIAPGTRFDIEARVSRWEGDGLEVRNGTIGMVLAAGF